MIFTSKVLNVLQLLHHWKALKQLYLKFIQSFLTYETTFKLYLFFGKKKLRELQDFYA